MNWLEKLRRASASRPKYDYELDPAADGEFQAVFYNCADELVTLVEAVERERAEGFLGARQYLFEALNDLHAKLGGEE